MQTNHRSHAERERLFSANTALAFAAFNAWARANADLMARYRLEREDLESVALLALWTATGAWEPCRGSFSTVATLTVRHALAGAAQDARRLKRGGVAAPAVALDDATPGSESRQVLGRLTDPDETPERCAIRRDVSTRLWRAVEALPARTREVLLLRFVDDLPLAEAGARLGLTRQRVHQIAGRGLAELRNACPLLDPVQ